MTVLQPKRKSTWGSLLCFTGKQTIQVVEQELGSASLSRDGATKTGREPAAVVTAEQIASVVVGIRQNRRLSSILPKLRETFEIRYETKGDASSTGALPKTLFVIIFSCRTFVFPLVGQIANCCKGKNLRRV